MINKNNRTETFYFNHTGDTVPQEDALRTLTRELNEDGEIMSETRTEIYFFNDAGETASKADATRAIVRELDKDGDLVLETFMNKVPTREVVE